MDAAESKYSSKYKWYPRKPYYQRFLACYEIKLLKPGDEVSVSMKNGHYTPKKIKNIDWTNNSRNKLCSGVMYEKKSKESSYIYKNYSVTSLRKKCFLAMKTQCWAMEGDVKSGEQISGNVQFREFEWKPNSWMDGTVCQSVGPNRSTGMVLYDKVETANPNSSERSIFYVHPWNFECIRPT